jgi:6-pyruvoyltetrahydropterin/6-carboxytetrahydropterin synthase
MPLPVDNITAERLAEYLWREVARELAANGGDQLSTLTVGVEESPGQTAYFSRELSEDAS